MTDAASDSPEFITLEEAAAMTEGTRVTFIPGLPALYAEALKNICYVKGIPLVRALHPMMGVDKETGEDRQARLYELTSQTSIPTMFHDQERPRNVKLYCHIAQTTRTSGASAIACSSIAPEVLGDDVQQVDTEAVTSMG